MRGHARATCAHVSERLTIESGERGGHPVVDPASRRKVAVRDSRGPAGAQHTAKRWTSAINASRTRRGGVRTAAFRNPVPEPNQANLRLPDPLDQAVVEITRPLGGRPARHRLCSEMRARRSATRSRTERNSGWSPMLQPCPIAYAYSHEARSALSSVRRASGSGVMGLALLFDGVGSGDPIATCALRSGHRPEGWNGSRPVTRFGGCGRASS